ncbi:ABC transporter ATP-binding protein [Nocardioides albus]|uniref:Peptide/nickel transport system ATP-binding protein n=1 Tax=Nocardioides albus TaxID=1841 RepID=A0A7W5A3W2_9ACTN|nr:ABC transporter ATP-binding protein [Nocardioides albus]MBB3088998.1 peptide/nickel transport system ATP-binding protein [Nocardioides albus]GGU14915.1 dipeptide/oligopeptide/nickel ABC transporter ATP-binding protein [Nocardioides albus]
MTATPTSSRPKVAAPLLEVEDLSLSFRSGSGEARVLHDVSFSVGSGEIVGLVGESGSGKTVTSLALAGLLDPRTAVTSGNATLNGEPLLGRGSANRSDLPLAMIFQEPMTALDPVFTIGSQLMETLTHRQGKSRKEAKREALVLLEQVGISDPRARLASYPHQLSGGMRQRVMIAIALACAPRLLIADEPTTAVDVTIQAQLLELIKRLSVERDMSVLFITHDLGVVAETCDRMITMYAGRIVEQGEVEQVLSKPRHPYTAGLLAALPSPETRGRTLAAIPGRVPPPTQVVTGCVFAERCDHRADECGEPQDLAGSTHQVRCVRSAELTLIGAQRLEVGR